MTSEFTGLLSCQGLGFSLPRCLNAQAPRPGLAAAGAAALSAGTEPDGAQRRRCRGAAGRGGGVPWINATNGGREDGNTNGSGKDMERYGSTRPWQMGKISSLYQVNP